MLALSGCVVCLGVVRLPVQTAHTSPQKQPEYSWLSVIDKKKSTELENICHFSKTADAGLAQWVCLVVFPFERHMIYLRMTGKHFNADLLVHSFLNFTHHNEIVA